MSEYAERIRREFGESDFQRDKNLTTPQDIQRYDNIFYGKDGMQVLDVYRPKNSRKKLPVILNVHGGGWVYGTKETYQFYAMDLAQKDFVVVNFTYRLAPEHKFPAFLEDINSVVKWIVKNSDIYGFDLENFFATGDSAGAHILSLYTAALSNAELQSKFKIDFIQDFNFKALVLNCGKYSFKKEAYKDRELLSELLETPDDEQLLNLIETVDFITPDFPPSFLMTCQGDFLKEQTVFLVKELTKQNVPFEFHFYRDEKAQLWHCFQNTIDFEPGKKCRQQECDFFRSFVV